MRTRLLSRVHPFISMFTHFNDHKHQSEKRSVTGIVLIFLLILLASCNTPTSVNVPTASPKPEVTSLPNQGTVRFALIGDLTNTNAWALFDTKGYSYNNYAVRSAYWPRLYRLSTPGRQFEALAADGMPAPIQLEGKFYTAIVRLRPDLSWTGGSPLTAEDVAFTANTVLSFELGFDWHDFYDPEWLDHVEAIDATTVKFFFKKIPNVGVWQYGALQGPILQKKYWYSKIADPSALLPSAELRSNIETLKINVADLQTRVDAINAELALHIVIGEAARQLQAGLLHQQGDLSKATNDLSKAQNDFDAAMDAARTSLYALDDVDEPHLGTWEPSVSGQGRVENVSDPKFPFEHPGFDRVSYLMYPTEEAAVHAFMNDEVDAVLEAGGLSPNAMDGNPSLQNLMKSPSRNLQFLVINPLSTGLNDPALRQALACMIDQDQLAGHLNGQGSPLKGYVLPAESFWVNQGASLPCKGSDEGSRLEQAVQILKSAGYTWKQEPTVNAAGQKLTLPNGQAFPSIKVSASDDLRTGAAAYIQHQARKLGIPLTAQATDQAELNYSVLSSFRYDMAVLGWKVSSYPGYLCAWFGRGSQFHYDNSQVKLLCDALNGSSDLMIASQKFFEIQSVLVRELPFIPLYSRVIVDPYQNMTYPFDQAADGLGGAYGAPALAIPAGK